MDLELMISILPKLLSASVITLKLLSVSLIIGTRDRTGPGRNWKKTGIEYELGRYDNLGKQVKRRNSKINVIELEGLGHLPQVEDFERYRKALHEALKYNN